MDAVKIYTPNENRTEPLRMNMGLLLERQAALHSDSIFVTQAESGEALSYDAFNRKVNSIAHGLIETRCDQDEYLGIMLSNSLDYLAYSYAMKKIGVVEVSINSTFRGVSLSRMINLTGLTTLVTSSTYLPFLQEIISELPDLKRLILLEGEVNAKKLFPTLQILSSTSVQSECEDNCAGNQPDDAPSSILFTSGTTGVSKGCLISHRCAIRAAESMIEAFDLSENDCVYSPYPLFHVGASHYDILPALMVGARAVIREKFSVTQFWSEVVHYGATWFMTLGSVQQLLWAAEPCPEEKMHQLRFIWGTPLPVNHDAFEERFNVRLARGGGYGSTDAGSVALPLFDKTGGGKVLDRYEVGIVDENDDLLPTGSVGELVIRPREPAIMATGYFGMPDKTLEAWQNLWFHTGDLARLDGDGDLFWVARMSERIRVKGEMVSAYEIEEVILTHPAIEDCAVLGKPAAEGEESVHVFLTFRPEQFLDLETLSTYCTGKMSRFMTPTSMTILAEMPRTPSGKPAKGVLAKMLPANDPVSL